MSPYSLTFSADTVDELHGLINSYMSTQLDTLPLGAPAQAATAGKPAAGKRGKAAATPPAPPNLAVVPDAILPAPAVKVAKADVQAALIAVEKKFGEGTQAGIDQVVAILRSFGGEKISLIPEEKWAALILHANAVATSGAPVAPPAPAGHFD